VVVFASEETWSEFGDLLAQETRAAVAGVAHAQAHAGAPELLGAALPVLERRRDEQERELVERWREEVGRNGRACAGWEATLAAASDARVETLLFQDGADSPAKRCPSCGRLALGGDRCPLDGTALESFDDGLDLAVRKTLGHGGTGWAVRSRQDLDPVEGVGALLRF
jgi:peptide subunit release factor 1 (eRF1)